MINRCLFIVLNLFHPFTIHNFGPSAALVPSFTYTTSSETEEEEAD